MRRSDAPPRPATGRPPDGVRSGLREELPVGLARGFESVQGLAHDLRESTFRIAPTPPATPSAGPSAACSQPPGQFRATARSEENPTSACTAAAPVRPPRQGTRRPQPRATKRQTPALTPFMHRSARDRGRSPALHAPTTRMSEPSWAGQARPGVPRKRSARSRPESTGPRRGHCGLRRSTSRSRPAREPSVTATGSEGGARDRRPSYATGGRGQSLPGTAFTWAAGDFGPHEIRAGDEPGPEWPQSSSPAQAIEHRVSRAERTPWEEAP